MSEDQESLKELSRRGLLCGSAAAIAAATGGAALAADGHDGHGAHAAHHTAHGAGSGARHAEVIAAAGVCVQNGEVCLAHCIQLLGEGDVSMKDCAASVSAMLPMAQTLARLAALDVKRLKLFALVAIDFFKDCAAACRAHEAHHAACRDCMACCEDAIAATEKMIAA